MGMNELGPRRCPFAFASVMLNENGIIRKIPKTRPKRYTPEENGWMRKAMKPSECH